MNVKEQCLWELLIPTCHNNGDDFTLAHHQEWDATVKEIATGITIIKPVNGRWISPEGDEYAERMIPVRILCSKDEIIAIARHAKNHYQQHRILGYKIADEYFEI